MLCWAHLVPAAEEGEDVGATLEELSGGTVTTVVDDWGALIRLAVPIAQSRDQELTRWETLTMRVEVLTR